MISPVDEKWPDQRGQHGTARWNAAKTGDTVCGISPQEGDLRRIHHGTD
jgi:hypothetical protein